MENKISFMKNVSRLAVLLIIIISFLSCKKDDDSRPNDTPENLSGLMDSVIVYSSDSGNVSSGRAGKIKFDYDSERRVVKMQVEDKYYFFSYADNSINPAIMVDSQYSYTSQTSSIYKHQMTFNASGQKIKDTVFDYYYRDANNVEHHSVPTLKLFRFNHQQSYVAMKVNNNSFNDDTTYLNSAGDVPNFTWYSGGRQRTVVSGYHNVENPLHKSNIQAAFLNIMTPFILYTSHPLKFDMFQTKQLFTSITGTNDLIYLHSGDERISVNCYYDKDASDRVTVMVLATYYISETNGQLYGNRYTNYKFYYHP